MTAEQAVRVEVLLTTVQLYPEVLQHMTEVLQTPTVTTEVLQLLHHDHQVTAQAVAEDTAEAVQAEATAEEAAEARPEEEDRTTIKTDIQ